MEALEVDEISMTPKRVKTGHTFSEIPINFTDQVDSLEFCTFEKYLLGNKAAPINAMIVQTESMVDLFDMVLSQDNMLLTLEGPPGCGKTTTLIWLYSQLMKMGYNVICVPAFLTEALMVEVVRTIGEMPTNQPVYIFSDFCDVSDFSKESLKCWSKIFCSQMRNRQVVIFALSSGFHLPRVLGSRSIQSVLEAFYVGFQTYPIKQQESDTLRKIGLQFGVDVSSNAIVKACGLPKMIILENESAINKYIKRELRILIHHGIDKDMLSLQSNLYFLIALQYERSIFDVGLTCDDCEMMVPVLANLAYLNTSYVPVSYIPISDDLMGSLIRLLRLKLHGTVSVDEESIVDYVFESISINLFERPIFFRIDSMMTEIASMPGSPKRVAAGDILTKNTMYRCVKRHVAIDFVAITDIQGMESLLLIQTSVQATNHNKKLEKALKLQNISWKVDGSNTTPQHVVYCYVNPMATSDSYENRRLFFAGLGSHHLSATHNWKYGEVDFTSRGTLQKLYTDARASTIVCESIKFNSSITDRI